MPYCPSCSMVLHEYKTFLGYDFCPECYTVIIYNVGFCVFYNNRTNIY